VNDRKLMIAVGAAVLVIWLVGAAVTKYNLTEMAYLAPIAVVAVGLTIGLFLFWVKIITQMIRNRGKNGPFTS
jgi:phosphate/sulfate permease